MAIATTAQPAGEAALGLGGKILKAAGPVGQTLGAFAGGPVGAAIGGLAGQYLTDKFSPEAKAYREQMRKDISALQQGKLGFSEAEKRGMLAGTQRALQAQTAGVEANLRRQAAAMGGFGRSGAQTNALRGIAAAQGENLAKTAGEIDRLSQQTAENRFANIMDRLARQRTEAQKFGAAAGQAAAQTPASLGTYANLVAQGRQVALEQGLPSAMGWAASTAEEQRRRAAQQQQQQGGQ
jgi:hypothetical protein